MNRLKKLFIVILLAFVLSAVMIPTPLIVSNTVQAASASLNKTALTLYVGDTYSLKVSNTSGLIRWASSDKSIANVSSRGLVTGMKKGMATITATVNKKKYTCKVTVKTPSISNAKLTMDKASEKTLMINGANGKVTWKSSDTKVATVNSKGNVTAVNEGTAKITGTYNKKAYTCTITVRKGKIQADVSSLSIAKDTVFYLNITDLKDDENVQYEVKDPEIIDVELGDWSGGKLPITVKPLKIGSTSITITTDSRAEELVISVKVTKLPSQTTDTQPVNDTSSANTDKLTAEEVSKLCTPSTVQINTDIAIGSGFFIKSDTVVTNYHVIDGAGSIKVQLHNGESYEITSILGYDKNLDIAILKVPVTVTPLTLNSHGVTTGETVYAIGSSLGLTETFTNGIITNASRVDSGVEYIQTNAAITHGNSGGPLLNSYGEVMGINSWQYADGQNLNFAIKIDQVDKVDISKPIQPQDYYKQSSSSGSSSSSATPSGNVIYEDEAKSDDIATAQTITNGVYVYGEAGQSNIDYYKFTIPSNTEVAVIATNENNSKTELNSLYVVYTDSNGEYLAGGSVDVYDGMYYVGIDETLPAGTYYVALFADPDSSYSNISYLFLLEY